MMNGGDSSFNPVIEKPSAETLEKIDFVIQGLENGLFKEISEKVDFHQKLKGEESSRFITSLLEVIDLQKDQITNQSGRVSELEMKVQDLEMKLVNHTRDMRGIANGLSYLSNPDPFGQNTSNNSATHDTEGFIDEWKNKW